MTKHFSFLTFLLSFSFSCLSARMDAFLELANKALSMWQLHPITFSIPVCGLILNQFVRVGPGRALSLVLRSQLSWQPDPFTVRTEELQKLQERLMTKGSDQYIIVMGPKGVGKTVLVRSATATSDDCHPQSCSI